MRLLLRLMPALLSVLALAACDTAPPPSSENTPNTPAPAAPAVDPALNEATVQTWDQAGAIIDKTIAQTETLREALGRFLDNPTEDTLGACRLAWHRAHQHYAKFEPLLALSTGNPGLFGTLDDLDFAIDAHPIQPGFIDYFDVYTQSGIVNDIALPLTAEALRRQHGLTDASDVSLGFHAVEYLLWGEDGERPVSDYQYIAQLSAEQKAAGMTVVELPTNRRRALVQLLVNLLLDDLTALHQQWTTTGAPLRQNYLALQGHSRLQALQDASSFYLQAYLNKLPAPEADDTEEESANESETNADLGEAAHNEYAGNNAAVLGQGLLTIENLLLNKEEGLGQWVLSPEAENDLPQQVRDQREALLNWHDQPWPPEGEALQQLVATLQQLTAQFGEPGTGTNPDATNPPPEENLPTPSNQ